MIALAGSYMGLFRPLAYRPLRKALHSFVAFPPSIYPQSERFNLTGWNSITTFGWAFRHVLALFDGEIAIGSGYGHLPDVSKAGRASALGVSLVRSWMHSGCVVGGLPLSHLAAVENPDHHTIHRYQILHEGKDEVFCVPIILSDRLWMRAEDLDRDAWIVYSYDVDLCSWDRIFRTSLISVHELSSPSFPASASEFGPLMMVIYAKLHMLIKCWMSILFGAGFNINSLNEWVIQH